MSKKHETSSSNNSENYRQIRSRGGKTKKILPKLTGEQQSMLNRAFNMGWDDYPQNPPGPPGLAGEITDFIRGQSLYPVQAMSIAATMGLMAGICGRAFNISGFGLNQYFMLLAKSGMGKTTTLNGMDIIEKVIVHDLGMKDFGNFIGPEWFTPEPSMHDCVNQFGPSFVSVSEHIGFKHLKRMCKPRLGRKQTDLNQMIIDVYEGSGHKGRPALSILWTEVPSAFYSAIKHMNKNLASCITVIEYNGSCISNEGRILKKPTSDLVDKIANLAQFSLDHGVYNHNPVDVSSTREAKYLFDAFNTYSIEKTNSESLPSHIYARGYLRALRAAATIACGMPWVNGAPVIDIEVAQWAINLVQRGAINMENGILTSKQSAQSGFVPANHRL